MSDETREELQQLQAESALWKELAELYYSKVQYPTKPWLAIGALDDYHKKIMSERSK